MAVAVAAVQFSSIPRWIGSSWGHEGRFSSELLLVFPVGSHREHFRHGHAETFTLQCGQTALNRSEVRGQFKRFGLKMAKKCWLYLDIFNCL